MKQRSEIIPELDNSQSNNPTAKLQKEQELNNSDSQKAIEPSKRLIALFIDLIVCYLSALIIGLVVSLFPLLPNLLPQPIILAILFMSRDYFFGGHGIGKNLMGLQVVNAVNGRPITLVQSWMRNITLTAPLLVVELKGSLPGALLPVALQNALNILVKIYSLIFLPLESYRAYSREDSLRLGDILAQTKIIQSETDFSQLFPKAKD